MVASVLPVPQAAGPIAAAPGHFAHHDWLESSVEALDQALGQRSIFICHGPTNTQNPATNTSITLSMLTCLAKSPGCPAYTVGGANNGIITLGDGWPIGMYRVDWSVGFTVPGSPSYANACRTSWLRVNGASPTTAPSIVNMVAPAGSRPSIAPGTGSAFLKPLDQISVECRQDSGGGLDTSIGTSYLQIQFAFASTVAVSP